jgi:hypothetical protein
MSAYRWFGFVQDLLPSDALEELDVEASQGCSQRNGIPLVMTLFQAQDVYLLELQDRISQGAKREKRNVCRVPPALHCSHGPARRLYLAAAG